MALVVKDRVKETSTTTGTGTITLAGAETGFQAFSVVGDGNTTYYAIVDSAAGAWEVGVGTYTASGTTLSRDSVLSSSNGGALVNFSAATKEVFVTYPAEYAVVTGNNPGDVLYSSESYATPDWLPANGLAYLKASYPSLATLMANQPPPTVFSTITTVNFGWTIGYVNAFADNGSTIVAVGRNSTSSLSAIASSTNGTSWTSRTANAGANGLSSVAFGNSIFVAVGVGGVITTSPTGTTWTARTSGTAQNLNQVVFANGVFVAVGDSGVILTSTNGTSWTTRTSGTAVGLHGVAFGNSVFVARGQNVCLTSADGVTWVSQTNPFLNNTANAGRRLVFAKGLFYSISGSATGTTTNVGQFGISSDGTNWQLVDFPLTGSTLAQSFVYVNGLFFLGLTANADVATGFLFSDNDINWRQSYVGVAGSTNTVFGVGYFLGNYIVSSSDSSTGAMTSVRYPLPYNTTTQFVVPRIGGSGAVSAYIKT